MQFINNFRENFQQNPAAKKQLLAVGIVTLFSLGFIVLAVTNAKSNKSTTFKDTTYYDPASKQVVSSPANKSPETFSEDPNTPVYLGFSDLLDYGISEDQLTGIKQAFEQYLNQVKTTPREVSIFVDSISSAPYDITDPYQTISFKTLISRKTTVLTVVNSHDLTYSHVYIKDETGSKTLYDSGEINATAQSNDTGD